MIRITITPPAGLVAPTTMAGFQWLWAKYVRGFDRAQHCKKCLIGPDSRYIEPTMRLAFPALMNEQPIGEFDFVYLCGVALTKRHADNFHMVLRPSEGAEAAVTTYNGFRFVAQGAALVAIPALPDGFQGRSRAFTTCRNWQLGWAAYGVRSNPRAMS